MYREVKQEKGETNSRPRCGFGDQMETRLRKRGGREEQRVGWLEDERLEMFTEQLSGCVHQKLCSCVAEVCATPFKNVSVVKHFI